MLKVYGAPSTEVWSFLTPVSVPEAINPLPLEEATLNTISLAECVARREKNTGIILFRMPALYMKVEKG